MTKSTGVGRAATNEGDDMDEITRLAHENGAVAIVDGREVWATASGGIVKALMIAAAAAELEAIEQMCDPALFADTPPAGAAWMAKQLKLAIRMRSNEKTPDSAASEIKKLRAALADFTPVGAVLLGDTDGYEIGDWDVEWDHAKVDGINEGRPASRACIDVLGRDGPERKQP